MIQGDGEKVGITAEYDLVESISTSASYSKSIHFLIQVPQKVKHKMSRHLLDLRL